MNSESSKTIYMGSTIRLLEIEEGLLELTFDRSEQSSNKLDKATFSEMKAVLDLLDCNQSAKGLLVSSAKQNFIVGADLAELAQIFRLPQAKIFDRLTQTQSLINRLEDLPFPTLSEINGMALGGGFEICLATDYRVMASHTYIGQPEVNFGIIPGYGATVRLSRVIPAEDAIQWISSGKYINANTALSTGAVDQIAKPEELRKASLDLLKEAVKNGGRYKSTRQKKCQGILLDTSESQKIFSTAEDNISKKMAIGNKAPLVAVQTIAKHAYCDREEAMNIEADMVSGIAKEITVKNLVGTFLADQQLDRRQKERSRQSTGVETAAVLGAGVMGGGIAYQSALKGTPIYVKDIDESSINVALNKATDLANKFAKRKGASQEKVTAIIDQIHPVLDYDDFGSVDLVIEAVTEKLSVKSAVLKDCESRVSEGAVLTSNTSTISISKIAQALERPENFCGMHFFNPVDKMPLVEVIRGKHSSEYAVAKTVSYALSLGKKPVVVNDCAGFLVNRIIFPYVFAFLKLVQEGVHIETIDSAMKAFGWPMGPAFLCDVVGIDVLVHASSVMSDAYPDRMSPDYHTALQTLFENGFLGQKSGQGFYNHQLNAQDKTGPTINQSAIELLGPHCDEPKDMEAAVIVERMMLPLCLEAVRCLDEGIVEEAYDLDLALVYGIGFPPSRGGALRYIDNAGLNQVIDNSAQYKHLGEAYLPPKLLLEQAEQGQPFIE